MKKITHSVISLIVITLLLAVFTGCDEAIKSNKKSEVPKSKEFKPYEKELSKLSGQLVYVPVYSSIYNQYESNILHMTAILSIRNISPNKEIIITRIEYYDTNGKLIKKFIHKPFSLGKMSSKDFVIAENDLEGGTGANFLVEWDSKTKIATPIIESIMIGNLGTKGFSFTSRGKVIESH
tara:strand:+ start:96756 stop:97295 length:540 start_codon:yes stop_codon:yes gene_type:complete